MGLSRSPWRPARRWRVEVENPPPVPVGERPGQIGVGTIGPLELPPLFPGSVEDGCRGEDAKRIGEDPEDEEWTRRSWWESPPETSSDWLVERVSCWTREPPEVDEGGAAVGSLWGAIDHTGERSLSSSSSRMGIVEWL